MACDGLFDVFDNQLIAEIACPWIAKDNSDVFDDPVFDDSSDDEQQSKDIKTTKGRIRHGRVNKGKLAELAALRLRTAAEVTDSTDNVSVMVIML
ncbi:MAG: hypothetical protein EZS28_009648 [Streblomastix strix]|uniref:PPM-type phosphatase domain-containing protein n=1 Tax=Streblomastix strix TaxID=222440 RepID=A0A5J4WJC5_9EUKA|nr:MAG: hypothetical protein EZS28_009648 [Streblomastix strix]